MKAIYSFVIDGDKKFEIQTRLFLTTLLATGVEPSSVIAHCTPSASIKSRELASSFGVELQSLEPFFDGKYCNKLAQLTVLIRRAADVFVLCDTDLAFVGGIDLLFSTTRVRAKPVDLANPPIEILEELRIARNIERNPRIVETSCDRQPTYSVNCNGGLYVIPHALATKICLAWRTEVIMLGKYKHILGRYFHHADQIGFAMAMLSCGYDAEEIPIEFNFPMHLGDLLNGLAFGEPKVLHYHQLLGDDGRLEATGHPIVDSAVNRVNRLLLGARRVTTPLTEERSVFAYWDGDDRTNIHEFVEVWTNVFPIFRVFSSEDVTHLINKHFPEYAYIFCAVQIPAAKTNVARLILLYEFGGLFVDCHCGIRDKEETSRLLSSLANYEAVFIDLAQAPRPREDLFLINEIMLSQPKSKLILMVARQALANLVCHRQFERLSGRIPYHIGALTGPELITSMVLEPCTNNREIRSDYRGRVSIVREEIAPVERNRHRICGDHGQHWSERQWSELLFRQQFARANASAPVAAATPKIVVGSGWWSAGVRSQWNIGDDLTRSSVFFALWHRQVMKALRPNAIVVTDSHSPIKPDWRNFDRVTWIELDQNYGHANDLRVGAINTKFSGWSRSVMSGAMYALCCDADYFVYVEQDCLLKGENFLEESLGTREFDFFCGGRTEGGRGLQENTVAAPMLQQSVMVVKRSGLRKFITSLMAAPETDGELPPEVKMERDMAPYGTLLVPYGRSRPIEFSRSHFYAQHLTRDELNAFLESENLQFDDWFS